jgi:AbrB family looped-hinge helix DNA binding protein
MDHEPKVRISEGGRIVIPAEFRKQLGVEIGDELIIRMENGELRLLTKQQAILHAQHLTLQYLKQDRSLADELIAERRGEAYD